MSVHYEQHRDKYVVRWREHGSLIADLGYERYGTMGTTAAR
jgi:hypothetical protein